MRGKKREKVIDGDWGKVPFLFSRGGKDEKNYVCRISPPDKTGRE